MLHVTHCKGSYPLSARELSRLQAAASGGIPGGSGVGEILYDYASTLLVIEMQLRTYEQTTLNESTLTALSSMLKTVETIGKRLSHWPDLLCRTWSYTDVTLPDPSPFDDIYKNRVLVYPSVSIANTWSAYRTLRLYAYKLEQRCSALLGTNELERSAMSNHFLQELVNDICASAPFFLGYRTSSATEILYFGEPSKQLQRLSILMKIFCACNMMWPLYMAASINGLETKQRQWILGRLDFIGEELGVRQARALRDSLAAEYNLG
jgi:hypothetical protein